MYLVEGFGGLLLENFYVVNKNTQFHIIVEHNYICVQNIGNC